MKPAERSPIDGIASLIGATADNAINRQGRVEQRIDLVKCLQREFVKKM